MSSTLVKKTKRNRVGRKILLAPEEFSLKHYLEHWENKQNKGQEKPQTGSFLVAGWAKYPFIFSQFLS